jgi:hypothetical protein
VVNAKLRHPLPYRIDITKQSELQPLDTSNNHASNLDVLQAIKPGNELRKWSDPEHDKV